MTAQFQEISRIKVNDTTDIVVSMVKNDDSEIVGLILTIISLLHDTPVSQKPHLSRMIK